MFLVRTKEKDSKFILIKSIAYIDITVIRTAEYSNILIVIQSDFFDLYHKIDAVNIIK